MPGRPRRSVLIARLRGDLGELAGCGQQVILDELRRVILDGDAPPGTAIPVDEVAELFGVSRIPVRESLKTLIGEGLVEHRPRSGYTVAQLTLSELHEIYVLRGVLEQATPTTPSACWRCRRCTIVISRTRSPPCRRTAPCWRGPGRRTIPVAVSDVA